MQHLIKNHIESINYNILSFGHILELLPTEIGKYKLYIERVVDGWGCGYKSDYYEDLHYIICDELIDSLYSLLEWCDRTKNISFNETKNNI